MSLLGKIGRGFSVGLRVAGIASPALIAFGPAGIAAAKGINAAIRVATPVEAIINGPAQAEETGAPGPEKMEMVMEAFRGSLELTRIIAEQSGQQIVGLAEIEAKAKELAERSVAMYKEGDAIVAETQQLIKGLKLAPKA